MKLQITQNTSNLTTIQQIVRYVSSSLSKVQTTINSNDDEVIAIKTLDAGNMDLLINGNNKLITCSFINSNTNQGFAHGLGAIPRGFITAYTPSILTVFAGTSKNTTSTIYLQCTSQATVKMLVF